MKDLGISEKDYHVVASSYTRFPVIVMKIITDPKRTVRLEVVISNKPNCLAPLAKTLSEFMTLFGLNGVNRSNEKQFLTSYGILSDGKNLESVREAVLKINEVEKRDIIDPETFSLVRLEDYVRIAEFER